MRGGAERSADPVRRFILHPGMVRSQRDGQAHFIDARQLARLYGLPWLQCYVASTHTGSMPGDVHLFPREDGDYTMPPDPIVVAVDWIPDPDWTADPELLAGRVCRGHASHGCDGKVVAGRIRPTVFHGHRTDVIWGYCAQHLGGRKVQYRRVWKQAPREEL